MDIRPRTLLTGTQLTDLYPTNLDSEVSCNIALRRLLCDFLGAIISMAQARIQVDRQLQVSLSTPQARFFPALCDVSKWLLTMLREITTSIPEPIYRVSAGVSKYNLHEVEGILVLNC
jgi:hypothetical protein